MKYIIWSRVKTCIDKGAGKYADWNRKDSYTVQGRPILCPPIIVNKSTSVFSNTLPGKNLNFGTSVRLHEIIMRSISRVAAKIAKIHFSLFYNPIMQCFRFQNNNYRCSIIFGRLRENWTWQNRIGLIRYIFADVWSSVWQYANVTASDKSAQKHRPIRATDIQIIIKKMIYISVVLSCLLNKQLHFADNWLIEPHA